MAKPHQDEPSYSDVSISSDCDNDGNEIWTVHYRGTHGRMCQMQLDAETLEDAIYEAANYCNVDESEVTT